MPSRHARRSFAAFVLGLGVTSVGCYDWTVIPRETEEGTSSPDGGTSSPDGGTSSPDGGTSSAKSCHHPTDCPNNEYCVFPDHSCGNNGGSGTCAPTPPSSTCAEPEPVCTCDGTTAENRCVAASLGLDLSAESSCASTIPDMLRCGFKLCRTGTFCLVTRSRMGVDYQCKEWTCPEPERSCSCKDDLVNACSTKPACETAPKTGSVTVYCDN